MRLFLVWCSDYNVSTLSLQKILYYSADKNLNGLAKKGRFADTLVFWYQQYAKGEKYQQWTSQEK